MVKIIFISLLLTIPIMALSWWFIPVSISYVFIFIVSFFLWMAIIQGWKKEWDINRLDEEMYYWVQNFITTLSIKKTITEAYVDLSQRYQLQKVTWLKSFSSNDVMQTMMNLKQRFHHPMYDLFCSTLNFYDEQGGEVMTLFESVLFQTRLMESRRLEMVRYTKRYFFQWMFLWALNVIILILSKWSLPDLYGLMKDTIIFQMMMILILLGIPLTKLIWYFQWSKVKQKIR